MLELGVKFLISYGIGSVMGAFVAGVLHGGIDIRTRGSGNAGATNALRTQGWSFAVVVAIVDVGKGALGAGLVPGLALPLPPDTPPVDANLLLYACAAAAVMGHVWAIWQRFRGGKGAATLIGTLTVLAPVVLLPVIGVWALMAMLFGYVGLATMSGVAAGAAFVGITQWPDGRALFLYMLLAAAFMIYTHRSNIQRMREGKEPQNTRLMVLRRSRAQ